MQPGDDGGPASGKQPGDLFICAVGADEHGERLVRCAHRLARGTGLRPLFIHVVEAGDDASERNQAVWQARSLLRHAGARTDQMRVAIGDPAAEVTRLAREEHAVLILAAARGFGPLKAALLGSVSRRLMETSPVPVMILPPKADPWFDTDRLLCLGSGEDRVVVLAAGTRLARVFGRELAVAQLVEEGEHVRIMPPPRGWPGVVYDTADLPPGALSRRDAARRLDALARSVSADVVVVARPRGEQNGNVLPGALTLGLANQADRAIVVVPTGEVGAL